MLAVAANVRWLTNFATDWKQLSVCVIFGDGRTLLISANSPAKEAAVDEAKAYVASTNGTQRSDQPATLASAVVDALRSRKAKKIAVDAGPLSAALMLDPTFEFISAEPIVHELRRAKDADELAMIRTACGAAGAMYERARAIITPGIAETHVFAELHAAAVEFLGEPMALPLGNDYACGVGGGPPRWGKKAEAGQLYILDVGPNFRGYFADASRVFPVDGKVTDVQQAAWAALSGVFPLVEKLLKPGMRCREVCDAVDAHLKSQGFDSVPHHLGHGVGLFPHEGPHLNRGWDETLAVGDVFSVEPGIYREDLRGGLRLENLYAITKEGLENLTPFPMALTR